MPETFPFEFEGQSLRATEYRPSKPLGMTMLFGPGTDGEQQNPFVVDWAGELAQRGVLVVTYDFPFAALGRREPDADPVLERCCRSAMVAARQCRAHDKLFAGGKSLGARIASRIVAEGGTEVEGVYGLVSLGYPLHPLGHPEQQHASHLSSLVVPMLFVQGTRDPFGTPDELRPITTTMPAGTEIVTMAEGDHSLRVPGQDDTPKAANADAIVRWMAQRAEAGQPRRPRGPHIASRTSEQLRELHRRAK